jgi:translation initiation factor 1
VKPFHNPFGALGERFGVTPDESLSAAPPRSTVGADPPAASGGRVIPRAVVRIERAGRGGKDVTVVDHLDLPPVDRERWLKALKAALGCGGVVEGDALVLQGDHRRRLPKILAARGVKRVTVST